MKSAVSDWKKNVFVPRQDNLWSQLNKYNYYQIKQIQSLLTNVVFQTICNFNPFQESLLKFFKLYPCPPYTILCRENDLINKYIN